MKSAIRTPYLAILACVICGCSGGSFDSNPGGDPPLLSTGPADCVAGAADEFACSGIALRARVPFDRMNGSAGTDIWGWVDSTTGDEFALVGMTNGTAFVDVSDPESPVFLGRLPTQTRPSAWRDIKVFGDHAYVVADGAGPHGMQVFDLTRLRDVTVPRNFSPDAVYGDFANAHNLAINEATGFAYAVGTNTCAGGLHMIDISTPNNPLFAGCHPSADTHDTQCVIYAGPDTDHQGAEICVSSNEDHVEIADVSNKSAPQTLAISTYPQIGFVHQGWLTDDQRFLLVGDELDESIFNVPTRTHVFDVRDLDSPVHVDTYEGPTRSIDHNLYILGNRIYEANYTAGLRILEFGDLENRQIAEIAFFDTFPANDAVTFDGAWSVYPYLPSGNLVVNDDTNGLFILTPQ